jgi:endoglucanase
MKESLPLWYGFNILEKFQAEDLNLPFNELDFKRASQWGFNFFRLPMDYRCWIIDRDPYKINEKVLSEIDEAVALGEKYGIHLNLCFHRAPGYSVNRIAIEPLTCGKTRRLRRHANSTGGFSVSAIKAFQILC